MITSAHKTKGVTRTKIVRVYPFVFIAIDDELQRKADRLFKQSLEQVNYRVLGENKLECIMNNEFAKEEFGKRIEGIPYQVRAEVAVDNGQFKDMIHSMLDDPNQGHEKEVYFYLSDHLGGASWITDVNGKPVQHLQYLPFGEPYIDQRAAGTTYSERFRFTGEIHCKEVRTPLNSITFSEERDEEASCGYCDDYQPHAEKRMFDYNSGMLYDMRWDKAGNLGQVSMARLGEMFEAGRFLFWTEDCCGPRPCGANRMHAAVDDKHYSYHAYDYGGERRLKLVGVNSSVDVNAEYMTAVSTLNEPTLYPSAYMVLTNKGYTKHYYAGTERVAARLGGGGLNAQYHVIDNDRELQTKADSLFDQCLEQVNSRVLKENDLDCIMGSEFAKEEFGHWIDGIPYQMQAGVEINHDQFKEMVNSMLDDNYHGQEKEVYFYHSDLCGSRAQSQTCLSYAEMKQSVRSNHLGSASWKKERFGKPFASERAEEARSGILHITTTYVQHLQYLPTAR